MSSPANSAASGPSEGKPSQQQQPQQQQQQQHQQQQQQQQQPPTSAGDPQRGSPGLTNLPSQADLDKIVASYLQKKGYKATEAIFKKELGGATLSLEELSKELASSGKPISTNVLKYAEEGDPNAYIISYRSLREWIENSLDWYKPELRSVLFPIFVHAYLDLVSKDMHEQAQEFMEAYKDDHIELHMLDINRLETITASEHVRENELAQLYRSNKYNLRMSGVPFELFLNYLQDNKYMLLLRIVNQYLNIQVIHGKLMESAGALDGEDGTIGITGHEAQQIESFNQQPLQLGQPQMDPAFREEVEQALKSQDAARKDGQGDGVSTLLDMYKKVKQEATADGPAFGDIPFPPYRGTDIQAEIDSLNDLRKRVSLGSASLPSICCYTFHNTHDGLNCLSITEDATLIAGGFSESFIKIWSLKGEKLRGLRNTRLNPADINDLNDLNRQKERHGSEYKRLIGHSGPVYGTSFSHDNKYLISCSEDKTARLWSTQTYSNLVVYKGHNYPIWDVSFGPFGYYFATASHDRTARLWSCDHIHPLRIFAGHLSDVDAVRFHPNSKYLVTGSSDRTCRLWDVQRGTCVRVFTGHTGSVKAVAVSPNGRLMASAGEDKSIMLWDLGSGRRLKKMTGHTGFIYSVDFSADSNVLVSGGADGTVRVWDVNKNTPGDMADAGYNDSMDTKRIRLEEPDRNSNNDQLGVFPTKHTPVYKVQFTKRNLCLVAGAFTPPDNPL
ncbi:WD40-repeat-containing domain protein [Dichotomocladium elegans]|nr:WD40-repeat-containing domain protein [Dichotomocladium elegans]